MIYLILIINISICLIIWDIEMVITYLLHCYQQLIGKNVNFTQFL